MVEQLNSFASEVTRVAREVGTEGKLGGQSGSKRGCRNLERFNGFGECNGIKSNGPGKRNRQGSDIGSQRKLKAEIIH